MGQSLHGSTLAAVSRHHNGNVPVISKGVNRMQMSVNGISWESMEMFVENQFGRSAALSGYGGNRSDEQWQWYLGRSPSKFVDAMLLLPVKMVSNGSKTLEGKTGDC